MTGVINIKIRINIGIGIGPVISGIVIPVCNHNDCTVQPETRHFTGHGHADPDLSGAQSRGFREVLGS